MSERSRRAADRRMANIRKRYRIALCAADAPAAETLVAEALAAGIAPTTIMVGVITSAMGLSTAGGVAVKHGHPGLRSLLVREDDRLAQP